MGVWYVPYYWVMQNLYHQPYHYVVDIEVATTAATPTLDVNLDAVPEARLRCQSSFGTGLKGEFPKIRGTLFRGPYHKGPTIYGIIP